MTWSSKEISERRAAPGIVRRVIGSDPLQQLENLQKSCVFFGFS